MKSLCSAKDPVKWMKRQATDCEKTFANHFPTKEYYLKYKELLKLNSEKRSNPIRNYVKDKKKSLTE